jgi:hypothetical protein
LDKKYRFVAQVEVEYDVTAQSITEATEKLINLNVMRDGKYVKSSMSIQFAEEFSLDGTYKRRVKSILAQ